MSQKLIIQILLSKVSMRSLGNQLRFSTRARIGTKEESGDVGNQHFKNKTLNHDDGIRLPQQYLHLALKDKGIWIINFWYKSLVYLIPDTCSWLFILFTNWWIATRHKIIVKGCSLTAESSCFGSFNQQRTFLPCLS